jgi:FkbM family methyltransferase
VSNVQKWISRMLLHAPTALRSLRGMPWLGNFVHRLSYRLIPVDQKIWARIQAGAAEGLWIELNPRTGQSYVRGEVETVVQKILTERLKPGMIFYDLGANIGLFTLIAARLVGPGGKVFSFEPDQENAARLRRNVERNQFGNVTVVEAGVWSSSGNFDFVGADTQSPDRGVGTFIPHESWRLGAPAKCFSLDDFTKITPAPDAIKCDVEGAEVEVIRGAEKMLQDNFPWIVCETHSEANDRKVRETLSRIGYNLEDLDHSHILARR